MLEQLIRREVAPVALDPAAVYRRNRAWPGHRGRPHWAAAEPVRAARAPCALARSSARPGQDPHRAVVRGRLA
jgi:hypothetical protein